MIRSSFIFLEGIQRKTEKNIHSQGIKDWNDFLSSKVKGISPKRKSYYDRKIKEAKQALRENNSEYFAQKMPSTETWRLYKYFQNETVFMDIETSNINGFITVIGLYDGENTKIMIKDLNLDIQALMKELKKYKLLVTFNGNVFDLPFIKKRYKHLIPNIPTIDLRFLCRKLNLKGGLKDIERQLNIKRPNPIIQNLYGGDPYKLWRMWKGSGDKYYLNLLVEYNEEDVINLKSILEICIEIFILKRTNFGRVNN